MGFDFKKRQLMTVQLKKARKNILYEQTDK